MKYIKAFKMFESSPAVDFIIKNETTPEEFRDQIQSCLDEREEYGSGQTFEDVVEDIVRDSIDAAGKSGQKPDMISQLSDRLDNGESEPHKMYRFWHDDSTNYYNGKVVCEYETTGHDGYGYKAEVGDVEELLSDLKTLIKTGSF